MLTKQCVYPDPALKKTEDRISLQDNLGAWLDLLPDCFAAFPRSVSYVLIGTLLPSLVMHLALRQNLCARDCLAAFLISELLKNTRLFEPPRRVSREAYLVCSEIRFTNHASRYWWSQAGSNRRPPACSPSFLSRNPSRRKRCGSRIHRRRGSEKLPRR